MDMSSMLWPDLTLGNVYPVIGIEGAYYRLLGDLGKPFLYKKVRFKVVDPQKDESWIRSRDKRVGEIWYPREFMRKNFFESFFSGDSDAAIALELYIEALFEKKSELVMRATRPVGNTHVISRKMI